MYNTYEFNRFFFRWHDYKFPFDNDLLPCFTITCFNIKAIPLRHITCSFIIFGEFPVTIFLSNLKYLPNDHSTSDSTNSLNMETLWIISPMPFHLTVSPRKKFSGAACNEVLGLD